MLVSGVQQSDSVIQVKGFIAQSCLTLCDPMDCSLPASSAHGILQARILEWVAIPFSRRSSQPKDQTQVSYTAGRLFTIQAIRVSVCVCVCVCVCVRAFSYSFLIFLIEPFLKSLLNLLQYYFCFCVLVFWVKGMGNLHSPARN